MTDTRLENENASGRDLKSRRERSLSPRMRSRSHSPGSRQRRSDRPSPPSGQSRRAGDVREEFLYASSMPVPFAEFLRVMDHEMRRSLDPRQTADMYDQYKTDYDMKRAKLHFELFADESWFREKYDPIVMERRRGESAEVAKRHFELIMQDVQAGALSNLSFDQSTEPAGDGIQIDEHVDPLITPYRTAVSNSMTLEQLKSMPPSLLVKNLSPEVTVDALNEVCLKDPDVAYVVISEPNRLRRNGRTAWLILRDGAEPDSVLRRLNGTRMTLTIPVPFGDEPPTSPEGEPLPPRTMDYTLHVYNNDPTAPRVKTTSDQASLPEQLTHDYQQARQVAHALASVHGFDLSLLESQLPVSLMNVSAQVPLDDVKKGLDIWLLYLRRVHCFCYYCGKGPADSMEMLTRQCGSRHVRRKLAQGAVASKNAVWREKIDRTAEKMLNGVTEEQLEQLGFTPVEPEVEKFISECMEQVDKAKFRCKIGGCVKLFKGQDFLLKHISNKHAHVIDHLRKKLELWSAFLRDPFRYQEEPSEAGGVHDIRTSAPPPPRPHVRDGRSDRRYTPYEQRRPQTGRPLRSYVDLDAPTGAPPVEEISYD